MKGFTQSFLLPSFPPQQQQAFLQSFLRQAFPLSSFLLQQEQQQAFLLASFQQICSLGYQQTWPSFEPINKFISTFYLLFDMIFLTANLKAY